MINTVLFDLGNVILPFDITRLAGRLSSYCDLSADQVTRLLWNDVVANTFETGKMTETEYFNHITAICGFKDLSYDAFLPIFNDIFEEDHGMVSLVAALKKNYKLGLISNTNPIHVAYITQKYPNLSHFDRFWWSNEHGLRKPDERIYRLALDHFDVEPEQTVFVDDLPANIDGARKLGINAILFKGLEPLKAELTQLGVRF